MKDTFILKTNYLEYFNELGLSDAELGRLMFAIFNYNAADRVPTVDDLGGVLYSAFMIIKIDLDKKAKKYAETCQKRSEAGRQGGRPRNAPEQFEENQRGAAKKANAFPESNYRQTKQNNPDNDSGSDYECDSDIDSDSAAVVAVAPAAAAADEAEIERLYEEVVGKKWTLNVKRALYSYGLPAELIRYAINEAADNDVPKLSYIRKILETKKKAGITCVEGARARPPEKGGTKIDEIELIEMRRRMAREGAGGP